MMRIILCEGETDAILLGYYLNKTAGWKYCKKSKILKIQFSPQDNKCLLAYQNDKGEELLICGVGGKDSFKSFFENYLYDVIWLSHCQETKFRIAVVTDRDNASVNEIERNITEQFFPVLGNVKNDCWTRNMFCNSFGENAIIDVLLIAIPKEKEGALENLLMDSLSENDYDANVVEICKNFVIESIPKIGKYVSTERLKIKAQLGIVLSVMNPERVFSLFDEYINSVQWENSKVLNECFKHLIEI